MAQAKPMMNPRAKRRLQSLGLDLVAILVVGILIFPVIWLYLVAVLIGLTRFNLSLRWQVLLVWLLPPLIFMAMIFKDSRTHAYTYLLPLLILAGIGIDTLVRWLQHLLREKSLRIVSIIGPAIFLLLAFSYWLLASQASQKPTAKS